MYKTLGWSVTPFGVEAADEEGNDKEFIFEHGRWGLAKPALKRALKVARIVQKDYTSYVGRETVKILETLLSRWSYAKAMLKTTSISLATRRNYIQEAEQVRQILTLLSFGGDIQEVVKYLPDWVTGLTNSLGGP